MPRDLFVLIEEYYRRESPYLGRALSAIKALYEKATSKLGREEIKVMHVCGTHEHTVTAYGIRSLVPEGLRLIAGPGCPVCITPGSAIDEVCRVGLEDRITIYTYGDVYKLPGVKYSLSKAKSMGANVKVVYSFLDAVRDALKSRRDSIFVGVGFETTVPSIASPILRGKVPENLKIFSLYRLTAPGLNEALREHASKRKPVDGVIPPGHVSTIIGVNSWRYLADDYSIPAVVAGFEPLDYLLALVKILEQLVRGEAVLENEYKRVARWEGNVNAWSKVLQVFETVDSYWRGIGVLRDSGLKFKEKYSKYDAELEYGLKLQVLNDLKPGCKCAEITLGLATPADCMHFLKSCTPERPFGPCMVSVEGTCSVWARFGGGGLADEIAKELGLK